MCSEVSFNHSSNFYEKRYYWSIRNLILKLKIIRAIEFFLHKQGGLEYTVKHNKCKI